MTIHVFVNRGRNSYEYRGLHRVAAVTVTITADRYDVERGVLVFELKTQKGCS